VQISTTRLLSVTEAFVRPSSRMLALMNSTAPVGAGRHGLHRRAGEPVDDGAAGDQAEQERRVEQREPIEILRETVGEHDDDREDHRGRADDRRADQHRLRRRFEGIPGAVVLLEQVLGRLEVHVDAVVALERLFDVRNLLDQRELEHRLGVVGHGAVGVDRDRHRAHAEEAEGDQAEREDRRRDHDRTQPERADAVRDAHQHHDDHAEPVRAEVSGHEPRQDPERGPALPGRRHHFSDVADSVEVKILTSSGMIAPGQGAARDDRRKLPPEAAVAEIADQLPGREVGQEHRHDRREPHERGERRFEVDPGRRAVLRLGDALVEEVRRPLATIMSTRIAKIHTRSCTCTAGSLTASRMNEMSADSVTPYVSKPSGAGPDRVAGVVAGAVGDHARIARVVLLDVEHDLHQVGPDVRDLREDASGDPERGRAERLADREADEARTRVVARDEEQDAEHQEQLDADEEHPHAHARLERDRVDGKRLAREAREGGAGVRERVDSHAEPRHPVAAADADQAEGEDDQHLRRVELQQHAEVEHDDDADERFEDQQELTLGDQVRFAGLVDQLRDLPHRRVHRQTLELAEDHDPEEEPEHADDQADHQEIAAVHASDRDRAEIGNLEIRFPSARVLAFRRRRGHGVGRGREADHHQAEQQDRNDPEGETGYRKWRLIHAVDSFGGEIPATLRDAAD
jgi:hypothetical protein